YHSLLFKIFTKFCYCIKVFTLFANKCSKRRDKFFNIKIHEKILTIHYFKRLNDSAVLIIEHELAEQMDFKKLIRKILELYAEKEDL
ncbi:UNVERIFIED_CONTAM: hypothetical protein NCL1_60209, partial [Trichonephila clavipes]